MKKKLILLPIVGVLLYLSLSSHKYGAAYGGLGDLTGAIGPSGCGGGLCHGSTATTSTAVTVQLLSGSTPVSCYVPGTTYTLKITGQNNGSTTLPNFGFQVCVVKSSGAGSGSAVYAGTMGTAPTSTHVYSSSGSQIFEHYNASFGDGSIAATTGGGAPGSTYVETISWTAPAAGTGSVVIYGVLNAVNHDGAWSSADLWNVATPVTISESGSGGSITGTLSACAGGGTTTLTGPGGGTWSTTGIFASVNSSGVVTGISAGNQTINYTTACSSISAVVTINPLPSTPTGTLSFCNGTSVTLSDATSGGSWSSVTTSVATVVGSGVTATVTGAGVGNSVIRYTLPTTCSSSVTVTVNSAPPAITGTLTLCQGSTTLLSSGTGGTWTSGSPGVATVSSSGLVTATATGTTPQTAVITYNAGGCPVSATVTVNPLPVVSPISSTPGTVCQGSSISLTDPTGGGSWVSGSTGVATIVAGTGALTAAVTGTSSPVPVPVSYTVSSLGCSTTVTANVTVNPLPAVASITGTASVCQGLTTSLTDATSTGTWTSGSTGVATVSASGVVSGVITGATSPAVSTISYSVTSAGCTASATADVTVNPLPAAITGSGTLCQGATTVLSDAGGGSWAAAPTSIATVDGGGTVTGVSAGTATVTYSLPVTGCSATKAVTVNSLTALGAISGTLAICVGGTTTLSDAPSGGTWSSGAIGIATINPSSGLVTGITAGTAAISYTATSGSACSNTVTAIVTVNGTPAAIGGASSVCVGTTTALTDGTFGGTWSSSNTALGTISTTGALRGIAPGTDTISYTLSSGCGVSKVVTVNPAPSDFAPSPLCVGATQTLISAPSGGTWTSGTAGIATIGAASGLVTGIAGGTSQITYSVAGCSLIRPQLVNVNPAAISGPTPSQVCVGSSVSFTDGTISGSWTSSNTSFATVSSSGGVIGVAAGFPVISYTLPSGCFAIRTVTVNPLPGAVSGPSSVCVGQTITLTDTSSGGSWSSSTTAQASVGAGTGIVTGIGAGVPSIDYTITSTGCKVTYPVTVNALSAISGLTSMCSGLTTTLTDATPGGTWTSSNTSVATIVSSSGFVNALTPGSTTITYTTPGGCVATSSLTVISAPPAITGPSVACIGTPATYVDAGGGTWTSSNVSVGAIGGSSGILTPVVSGTTTLTYSLGTGCTVTKPVTVSVAPSGITGTASACPGGTTTLTDVTSGGTWTSSNANVTVGATSATTAVITGVTAGTAVISYTAPTGCSAIRIYTINPLPAPIGGTLSVCIGRTTALTETTSGGTWSSLPTTFATIVSSTGVATGVAAGTSNIRYTITATGCFTSSPLTVNPNPAAITGPSTVCLGESVTLSDAGGGTWAATSPNASVDAGGVVTSIAAGTAVITYSLPTGCSITRTETVNALPAPITGDTSVCAGSTTTLTSSGSGTWTIAAGGGATIGAATGIVTGISSGSMIISFTATGTGCGRSFAFRTNAIPPVFIGRTSACQGDTASLVSVPGGAWTSGNPLVATVGTGLAGATVVTGVVTGSGTAATSLISYTFPTGCFRSVLFTVNPLPSPIAGRDTVCIGAPVTLTDAGGGTWTSGSTGIATVGASSGVVTGVAIGEAVITYTLSTGCSRTVNVTVNAAPSPVTGTDSVCATASTALADGTTGGSWTSTATSIATVDPTGLVTGVAAGTATISYALPTGCSATTVVTVSALPSAIGGTLHVCPGATTTLTDVGGGTWTSGAATTASIDATTGVVTGIAAGSTFITYTLPTGCFTIQSFGVGALPFAGGITGAAFLCVDATIPLADTATGGTWSSVITSLATVGTSGTVTGHAAGVDTIKYTVSNACGSIAAVKVITINPLPVAGTIAGPTVICVGTPVTLTDTAAGGTWSSSNTASATIGAATGVVTGVASGTVAFTYTVTNGCGTVTAVTAADSVFGIPTGGTIIGTDSVCEGDTVHLGDVLPGGTWAVSNGNASVTTAGIVTGLTAGTDTVSYTVVTPCGTGTAKLLVNIRSHSACNLGVRPAPVQSADLTVYPNPSAGQFTVDMPETPAGATITIVDMLGKQVATKMVTDSRAQKVVFNLFNIAAGSYIVKVDAGTIVYRSRIVIW